MQKTQSELEEISEKNSQLEQEFETEINKKNLNSKQIGQIINSVNNIYSICHQQKVLRSKRKKPPIGENDLTINS